MSDPHGPIWIVNAPAQPYPDERFDSIPRSLPVFSAPPLDPQQPTPNDVIADASREALDNIETVLMHWTFHFISDMAKLRALRDLLKPPAPTWQAKDE